MATTARPLSWSQTLRLIFSTPMVPSEPAQPLEIAMNDLTPVQSTRSSIDGSSARSAQSTRSRLSMASDGSAPVNAFEFRDL